MLFNKSLSDVTFTDIEDLMTNRIEESEILDYKDRSIEDNNVLKEVTAFSNSRGGYLIYGIEESGRGGYPESINGIENSYNSERLEQLIISNIMPRINVQIKKIFIPDSERMILVLRIPEGQNKPYFNNRANKYYKRYNFEAKEMSESEIEALYRERFFGVSRLSQYINDVISFNRSRLPVENHSIIDGHIIVTPLRIEDKMMDIEDSRRIVSEVGQTLLDIPFRCQNYLYGIARPSRYGIKWKEDYQYRNVEVHRNGLIHCMQDYSTHGNKGERLFWDNGFACRLLQTILFSDIVYSKFNFVGKIKIVVKIFNCVNSQPTSSYAQMPRSENIASYSDEIYVEREWDSWKIRDDYLKIGKSIMDEISNYFGIWTSPIFVEEADSIKVRFSNT